MWNLPAPPGFQGLHPDKPVTVYQRHLPHWRQDGATYFVTFRLADSLPQSKLNELARLKADWEQQHRGMALPSRLKTTSQKAQERHPTDQKLLQEIQDRIETWLDQGMGSCVLKQAALASILISAMHHFDENRYELGCYVVMPNHVHAIVRPLIGESYPLEDLLGSWKKFSSRRINGVLKQQNDLWQDESYDRIIRDEEDLWRVIQYIGMNPARAGLAPESCPLWIRRGWVERGWRFEG